MSLHVIGAGIGRTGTNSLKLALEQLLDGPCYHALETFARPDHVVEWTHALRDEPTDWDHLFKGYVAAVDWPTAAFYPTLMERNPDAVVVLSTRRDPEEWWTSANATTFQALARMGDEPADLPKMIIEVLETRFTPDWRDHDAAIAAYERHNEEARARVPASRLTEWQPGDGWGPLCEALAIAEPDTPFPHVNSTAEFRVMAGLDPATP